MKRIVNNEIPYCLTEKDELLGWMRRTMCGCVTPTRLGNGEYVTYKVDDFFNEDYKEFLPNDNWKLVCTERADPKGIDIRTWAQEIDSEEAVESLDKSMLRGELYIALFRHEESGLEMEIIVWE